MEIRIGITNIGRELSFETEQSADEIRAAVNEALEGKASTITFTDEKGATYIVPSAGLAYVELGTDQTRRVGFVG